MNKRFGSKPYFTLIPCLVLFFVFCILPNITNFYYAMTEFNGVTINEFIGMKNYREIFLKGYLPKTIRLTFLIAILVTVFQNFIAVAMSILVSLKVRGSNFFRAVYFFPTAMGIFACATVWSMLLDNNYGQLPMILKQIGIDAQFWGTTKSVYTIIAIQVWMTFGYAMTIYYANIQSIPADMLEASTVDGATLWQKIRYIVLPSLFPSIRVNFILSMVGALQLRDIIFITTGGGPMDSSMNLPMLIYREAFSNSRHGLAAAYQIIHFIIILLTAGAIFLFMQHLERKHGQ